jgi:hypothetical protein
VIYTRPKFPLGRIVATRGAMAAMQAAGQDASHFLSLHVSGAWGDLDRHDRQLNEAALASGEDRIFSSYRTAQNVKLYVITEHDRSVTTILLPEEY